MTTQYFYLSSVNGGQKCLVNEEIITGRDPKCALVLEERQASRRHAKLSPGDGGILIEDLGSTNGTVVNGEKITGAVLVKPGEHMSIGELLFIVESAEAEAEAEPVDPDATMLISSSEELAQIQKAAAAAAQSKPAAKPKPQADVATAEKPKPAENKQPSPVRNEATERRPASQPPPSWVMNNQQSVDGTKFLSRDMLDGVIQESAEANLEDVSVPTLIGSCTAILNRRFQLVDGEKWNIGRADTSDVILNHESVSSDHAQIIHENGRWKVVDLMSANHTYINSKKCLSGYLSSGDVVRFGPMMECTFVLPAGSEEYGAGGGSFVKTAVIAFVVTAVLAAGAIFAYQTFL